MEKKRYNLPGTFLRKLLYTRLDYVFHNLDDVLNCAKVYGSAKRISIIAGELFPYFYNDDRFLKNFRLSAKNGAEIKVIFGPALYVESDNFLKTSRDYDNIELFRLHERESSHFKIIEDINGKKLAFVDERHNQNKDRYRKTVLLTDDYRPIISLLEKEFEKRLNEAELIDKDSLIEQFSIRIKNARGEKSGFISRVGEKVVFASDAKIEKLKTKAF